MIRKCKGILMKYSMFSWFGYFMPFKERIQMISEAGFDEAMISWEDEEESWPIKKEEFPEIVRKIEPSSGHGLLLSKHRNDFYQIKTI